ncbi:LysR family transcriptional regulator [Streptomyces sp. NBC_00009]|uniref:LysR family transcriptional regulator n=1 Tax=Streptomyces sp. NBC_00009 TaxID=2975620 RepID=UPI003254058D
MQLHQVEYFLAVVDHGGINAAATSLDLAQPTVSQAIRELERHLGVELFHRIGRGMVLTSAGHAFTGPARRLMRGVVAAEGTLPDAVGHLRGRLDICAQPSLAADPVARLVGAFRRQHRKVFIRISDLRDEETATTLLRDGHCELLFCHLPIPGLDGLDVIELGVQEYAMVFPPGTALPPEDPLPLSELPDIPQVVVPRGGSYLGQFERALAESGQVRRPAVVVQHREARLPYVLAGVGCTFMERSAAEEAAAARGVVVRMTDATISPPYGLVYDTSALSPAGRAFVELAQR